MNLHLGGQKRNEFLASWPIRDYPKRMDAIVEEELRRLLDALRAQRRVDRSFEWISLEYEYRHKGKHHGGLDKTMMAMADRLGVKYRYQDEIIYSPPVPPEPPSPLSGLSYFGYAFFVWWLFTRPIFGFFYIPDIVAIPLIVLCFAWIWFDQQKVHEALRYSNYRKVWFKVGLLVALSYAGVVLYQFVTFYKQYQQPPDSLFWHITYGFPVVCFALAVCCYIDTQLALKHEYDPAGIL